MGRTKITKKKNLNVEDSNTVREFMSAEPSAERQNSNNQSQHYDSSSSSSSGGYYRAEGYERAPHYRAPTELDWSDEQSFDGGDVRPGFAKQRDDFPQTTSPTNFHGDQYEFV